MTTISDISLTVVMPVYNEQENIVFAVEQTISEFKNFKKAELIVIDDGSNDKTKEKLLELKEKYKELIIERHTKIKDWGNLYKTVF